MENIKVLETYVLLERFRGFVADRKWEAAGPYQAELDYRAHNGDTLAQNAF